MNYSFLENYYDIFRLSASPDEILGNVKIYKMKPKNDVNYSDPLDILYMAAEATFLKMLRLMKSAVAYGNVVPGSHGGLVQGLPAPPITLVMMNITNRNPIESIKYIENETLKERFMNCKKVIIDITT